MKTKEKLKVMKYRILIIAIIAIFSALPSQGQNEMDALRYSFLTPGGTARSVSMGGAFGALGGDFSSLSTNPAGIAVYRSNEFTITPSLNFAEVGSSFYGNSEEDIKYNFNVGNIGLVFAFTEPNQLKETGWLGFQIGLGINRHANYNNRRIYEGFNPESSLMTDYLQRANLESTPANPAENLDPFTTGLAWETFLLDTLNGDYFVDMENGNVLQRRETNTSGSVREIVFTLGTNYSNRLYLGATFGFPTVRFQEEYIYTEQDTENTDEFFNSLEYSETIDTRGTGFNFKLGAIFRANDMIRLGAAVHTPTFYELEDEWDTEMSSDLSFGNYEQTSPQGRHAYELNTPLRLLGSLGLVLGTRGILSFDYDYADYTQMRLRSSDYMFSSENNTIKESFQSQHNIRAGGEIRFNPVILRAGYSLHTNPYKEGINDLEKSTISAGFGIRDKNFFVDFGYFLTQYSEDFFPYSADLVQAVEYDYTYNGFMMTLGFRF
ncbi:MAG: OmpP1/FadL family transporter [Bacteroidales bacterium]